MADLRFTWNASKASANVRKHRVAFTEAQTVFYDEEALLIADPDHSETEDRFLLLGLSATLRTIMVVHVYNDDDDTIRIISARKATAKERAMYSQRSNR